MTHYVRNTRRIDSLLGHCIVRAVVAGAGGSDEAATKYGPAAPRLSKWAQLRTVSRVTPKASRVAAFVVMWAVAMKLEERDEFSITEYERYWNEGERQTYRLQKEFRELWPEFDTPNELARMIVRDLDARMSARDIAGLPSRLMVTV